MKPFLLVYRDTACQPIIDTHITKLAIKGSGIPNTARVLGISKNTVSQRLKKSPVFSLGQSKHSKAYPSAN
jgi:transposase-like protein